MYQKVSNVIPIVPFCFCCQHMKITVLIYNHIKLQKNFNFNLNKPRTTYLILSLINIYNSGMSNEHIMSNYVRFGGRVSSTAECPKKDRTSPGRLKTDIIALNRKCVWFIECYPILHTVTKLLKTCLSVNCKVISVTIPQSNNTQKSFRCKKKVWIRELHTWFWDLAILDIHHPRLEEDPNGIVLHMVEFLHNHRRFDLLIKNIINNGILKLKFNILVVPLATNALIKLL